MASATSTPVRFDSIQLLLNDGSACSKIWGYVSSERDFCSSGAAMFKEVSISFHQYLRLFTNKNSKKQNATTHS
eukprot:9731557-Ditylum_brightwellii.AAC.1